MWVRGLKHNSTSNLLVDESVAPHVGAWIETKTNFCDLAWVSVAPHVGAWIETMSRLKMRDCSVCRTPCGCVD